MNFKKYLLFVFSCIFLAEVSSQNIETLKFGKSGELLMSNWEIFYIQDANSTIGNTEAVRLKKSLNEANTMNLSRYKGVCWFRKIFKTDTSLNDKHLSFRIELIGASEIYLNNKLIKKIGRVGYSAESEYLLNTEDEYVSAALLPNKPNELLIRFSNHDIESSYSDTGTNSFGLNVFLVHTDMVASNIRQSYVNTILGFVFLIFFLSLCFVHFIIYIFNKQEVSNLYYSGFCLSISILIISITSGTFVKSANALQYFALVTIISPIFIFDILPFMFRSFFKMQVPKWYKWILVPGIINIICFAAGFKYSMVILFFIIIFGSVQSLFILVKAFRQKKEGVKIIGAGLLLFIILVATILVSAFSGQGISTDNAVLGIFLLIFLVLSVVSIPISITVFLANRISSTNKSLSKKLIEVEELSIKSIEQEKEKQQILADQNIVLEKQVTERTLEISEQKKLIEEKNKDIIDSINYAKRIQTAMLPDEASFKNIFNNSFVLYQPRDIVSGDFYYATEINNNKLIVAADCTGHGVPGALMSMVGCNIINKLTHENKIIDPKIVLETLHTQLRQALKQDTKGSVNRDGMDIAAVLINEKEVIYAGANRPLIYFDNKNNLLEIKATKTPVGGSHIESVIIEKHILPIENIRQLYLFSDGFADQFGGQDGKKLMVSKFKLWLSQIVSLNVEEQQNFLSKNFNEWKSNTEQVDDVMVIGIRVAEEIVGSKQRQ